MPAALLSVVCTLTLTRPIAARIGSDVIVIQTAISAKLGEAIQFLTQFLGGFALGLYEGALLTAVMLGAVPALVISAAIMMTLLASLTTAGQKAYARAGAVALEAIQNIRTVAAFGAEEREAKRYSDRLQDARKAGIKKGAINAAGFGCVIFLIYCTYALALWYGSLRVIDDMTVYCFSQSGGLNATVTQFCLENPGIYTQQTLGTEAEYTGYSGGTVMTVLFSVIIGAFSLGQMSPSLAALSAGRGAAFVIYGTIERKSECDPFAPPTVQLRGDQPVRRDGGQAADAAVKAGNFTSTPSGGVLTDAIFKGEIYFKNVHFSYPTRPDIKVLDGFSLKIKAGQTVALVGESGCGKSTLLALVERFYEPSQGSIGIDGAKLRSLNVRWFRQRLAYVGQMPTLFSGSIAENIAQGAVDPAAVTREEIETAARRANAYDFIKSFPFGFETMVGAKGAQLSGGQVRNAVRDAVGGRVG